MKLATVTNLICLELRAMERGLSRGNSCKKKKKRKDLWHPKQFGLTSKKSLDQRDEVRSALKEGNLGTHLHDGIECKGFPGGSVVKNPSAYVGDTGSIPVLGRFPGDANGNLLLLFFSGKLESRGA